MTSLSYSLSPLLPSTYQSYPLSSRLSRFHIRGLSLHCYIPCCCRNHTVEHSYVRSHPLKARNLLVCAKTTPEEGLVPVADLEELGEKDWSFLEVDSINSKDEHDKKIEQILSAGHVRDTSNTLVSMASEEFIDRLVDFYPCQQLLVVHDSFLTLACIKERHDKVKCWQGQLLSVPEKWAPFDVVFLYFLPAVPSKLEETFKTLARLCAPGAKVVISHLQGRRGLEQQRKQYPQNAITDLPNNSTLGKAASDQSFSLINFTDDPSSYQAVLECKN